MFGFRFWIELRHATYPSMSVIFGAGFCALATVALRPSTNAVVRTFVKGVALPTLTPRSNANPGRRVFDDIASLLSTWSAHPRSATCQRPIQEAIGEAPL